MVRTLAPTAFGLVAGLALLSAPATAQAQTSVGFSIATPNFSLGIGNYPAYRPVPVVVPPVYAPPVYYAPRPVVPVTPHWTPYRGWHYHYGYPGYGRPGHGHPGHGPGPRPRW